MHTHSTVHRVPPRRRRNAALAVALWCAGVPACDATESRSSPRVVALKSVDLGIPDTMPYLNGRTQAVLVDGSMLLDFRNTVLHFSRTGALIASIGRPGAGPGEYGRLAAAIPLPGDSLLAGVDVQRNRLVVLRLADGSLQREVPMPFRCFAGQQWRVRGDTLFMPVTLDAQPFVRWVLSTDSLTRWGSSIPSLLETSTVAYSRGGEPSLAPKDEGWVLLMPADDRLFETDASGIVRSAVTLPRRRRVGVPVDLVEQTASLKPDASQFLSSLSLGVAQLSSGDYLVVHADSDFRQEGSSVEYSNTTYWISVVSADLQRACVDEPITFESIDLSRAVFHGDTLMLLARTIGGRGDVRSTQHRYLVSTEDCAWETLRRTRSN